MSDTLKVFHPTTGLRDARDPDVPDDDEARTVLSALLADHMRPSTLAFLCDVHPDTTGFLELRAFGHSKPAQEFVPLPLTDLNIVQAFTRKANRFNQNVYHAVDVGSKMNTDKANETREVLFALAELAKRRNVAMVMIRHLTKGNRDKAIYRGLGSIDITAACRSVMLVGKDAQDPTRRAMARGQQRVLVQHQQVNVANGGQAIVAGKFDGGSRRGKGRQNAQ